VQSQIPLYNAICHEPAPGNQVATPTRLWIHLDSIPPPAVLNYGWRLFIDWGDPDGLDLMFLKSSFVLTGRSPRETTLLRPLRISLMSEAEPDPIVDESEKNPPSQ